MPKMKKGIYIILTIVVMIVFASVYFYNSQTTLATYQSPDGNYELIIKRESLGLFTSTMPGDGGSSSPVKVILKNANGKVIGTSSNTDCGTLLFSIYVNWDLENNQVWYGKAKTINLITGKVEC